MRRSQVADLFLVLFYSGLRLGEVLAPRWDDVAFLVDMSGDSLHVRRAVSAAVEKEPKGRDARRVPLRRGLGPRRRPRRLHDPGRLRLRPVPDGETLPSRYTRAVQAAGLLHVKLHGLRHAVGSVLARSMPLVTVRDVLGDSDIQTTNRYLHSKIDAAAVEAIIAAFGTPSNNAHSDLTPGPH